jgi:hypothetical protein
MFSQLPKVFDRDFAVGFLLPAAALCGWIFAVARAFGFISDAISLEKLGATAVAIAIVWLVAIALMALNRPIFRFLEGYGDWHPLKLRQSWIRRYFESKIAPTLASQIAIDAARVRGETPAVPDDQADKLRQAVELYPDSGQWVLPTRFGNAFRALEVYSRVVYGIDAIPAWPRLQAVIPDDFKKLISESKSQLDFCINLLAASGLTLVFYIAVVLWKHQLESLWVPCSAIVVFLFGHLVSTTAVGQFGVYVKSAFDLYRGDLAKQLGLQLPRSMEQEREMWEILSRMMIYRSAFRASQLAGFRECNTSPSISEAQELRPVEASTKDEIEACGEGREGPESETADKRPSDPCR